MFKKIYYKIKLSSELQKYDNKTPMFSLEDKSKTDVK